MKTQNLLKTSLFASVCALVIGAANTAFGQTSLIDFGINSATVSGNATNTVTDVTTPNSTAGTYANNPAVSSADTNGNYWNNWYAVGVSAAVTDNSTINLNTTGNVTSGVSIKFNVSGGTVSGGTGNPAVAVNGGDALNLNNSVPLSSISNQNLAVQTAVEDVFYINSNTTPGTTGVFTFSGLNQWEKYNFSILSVRPVAGGDTRQATFSAVGGNTLNGTSNAAQGTTWTNTTLGQSVTGNLNTVDLNGLTADGSNKITLTMGWNKVGSAPLNAIQFTGYADYTSGTTTVSQSRSYNGNSVLNGAATVNVTGSGVLGDGTSVLEIGSGGGTLDISGASSNQTAGGLIGSGNLAVATGTNNLTINTAGTKSFATLSGTYGAIANNDYAGVLSGSGTIIKAGSGTQILSGANTFNGTVKNSAGTLSLNNVNALQNAKLDTLYGASATLVFGVAGNNTYNLGGLYGNRAIDMGGNSLNVSTANGSTFYDGVIGGTGSLTKSGANTLTLRGNNTFSGSVTISAGTLQISDDGPAGGGTIGTTSGITNNATLVYNLTTTNRTYSNAISGTGILNKIGAATLTLSGTNTYAGNTTVSAGTLLINGSTSSSSTVNVSANGTLGGNGTIGGNVNISANGILSPGNSPGLLTVNGTLALAADSKSNFEIGSGARGVTYDAVNVGGLLTYGGNLTLTIGAVLANTTYDLFGGAGGGALSQTGNFGSIAFAGGIYSGTWVDNSGIWTVSSGGQTFTLTQSTGDLSVVPEPATWALLAFSLTTVTVLRRRRS